MAENQGEPYKLFSSSGQELLAECPRCDRVLKVPRSDATEVGRDFRVEGAVRCPCGNGHDRIYSPPPKPKKPEKKPSRLETIFAQGLVWGILGAIVLGLGYVVLGIVAEFGDGGREPAPDLSAEVKVGDGQVQVTNQDSFGWTGCEVTLNSGIGGSWSQNYGSISPGQTVSGGLMAFTRRRGERFNPLTHALEDVLIDCSTPAGRAYWSGRF